MRSRFRCKTLAAATLCLILLVLAGWVQAPGSASNVHVNAPLLSGTPLDCATSTVRCVPSEYATIQLGMNAAVAGDIVWVTAGTYVQTVSAPTSGTSGNTITLLANGTVTLCGLTFSSKSYVRVIGVTIDPSTGGCSASHGVNGTGTNTGLEFWNVTVQNTSSSKGYSFDKGGGSPGECVSCIFMGGAITNIGNPSATSALLVSGNDTWIGYINFSTICYIGISGSGSRLRMLNNNFSGMIQCGISHPDFYYPSVDTNGYSNNLVEGTFGIGTPTASDNKGMHVENQSVVAWVDDVWRQNVNYNLGGAYFSVYSHTSAVTRMRFYNNSLIKCTQGQTGIRGCGNISTVLGPAVSATLLNNLIYEGWSSDVSSSILGDTDTGGSPTITKDYSLAYDPDGAVTFTASWTNQVHEQSNVNPNFVDVASLDFHLLAGSGSGANARGTGGPMTTATSCSGTTLNVAANGAANFFGDNSANLAAYGGKLVPGDTITVGTSTTRTIVSIASDAITVDSSLTCSASDPVYFGSSSTIDIGALPYKAGGYTLSGTYHQSGTTVTVTPNDAALARFAVVYENLIPKCLADVSNSWACTVGTGVVTVTLYPRYASATQSVAATGS